MIPIHNIGIKNFRVFDDQKGLSEELTNINLLTGTNNSGKSSVIKFLQMLKESVESTKIPFDLDLSKQEHLLGDFDNIIYNKDNKEISISLPFNFFIIDNLYITLNYIIPSSKNNYKAKLREVLLFDKSNNNQVFSFKYRIINDQEKESHELNYKKRKEEYDKEHLEFKNKPKDENNPFSSIFMGYLPPYDPLIAYIDWSINLEYLKPHLKEFLKLYKLYDKNKTNRNWLKKLEEQTTKLWLAHTEIVEIFKKTNVEKLNNFIKSLDKKSISDKEEITESDFEQVEYYYPAPQIEELLFFRILKILKNNLKLVNPKEDDTNIFEKFFEISWKTLTTRITSINYLSSIRDSNSRIYSSTSNSKFINLLKDYSELKLQNSSFVYKYLTAFKIGKRISVNFIKKYQLINVKITTFEGIERELVDFGYGIKQLILLLIQISVLAKKNKTSKEVIDDYGEFHIEHKYKPSTLLIEEPETNLHPKWQSLLADMFVEANNKFNIQLIIETHSEYLIRKFQTIVAQKKIEGGKINIFYLRNQIDVTEDRHQISKTKIQEDGSINFNIFDNGFFDENYKLELSLLNIRREQFLQEFGQLKQTAEINKNIITQLEEKIDEFTKKLDLSFYEQIITERFDNNKLSQISVRYLISGQYLLNTIDDGSDFSPVIIQYGRAIENELKQIFISIDSNKKWMFGTMQASLENIILGQKTGSTISDTQLELLNTLLNRTFNNVSNLKILLINNIRDIRNQSSHSGWTKTKQDALNYILEVNEFIDSWLNEK